MVSDPAASGDLQSTSSRRVLLRAAALSAAGSSVTALAACSTRPAKSAPVESPGVKPNELRADVGVLNSALDLEHRAIAAYTAGIPLLGRSARATARQFLVQELAHAAELSALIHQGGGKPNGPRATYELGKPSRAAEVLALLHSVEQGMIGAYLDVIARLTRGPVRSTVASILANEAEHISVLRASLGSPAVPSAFVTAGE